jgi:hypothetical protein
LKIKPVRWIDQVLDLALECPLPIAQPKDEPRTATADEVVREGAQDGNEDNAPARPH